MDNLQTSVIFGVVSIVGSLGSALSFGLSVLQANSAKASAKRAEEIVSGQHTRALTEFHTMLKQASNTLISYTSGLQIGRDLSSDMNVVQDFFNSLCEHENRFEDGSYNPATALRRTINSQIQRFGRATTDNAKEAVFVDIFNELQSFRTVSKAKLDELSGL